MSIREPAVAGMFYPAGAAALENEIEACFQAPGSPGELPIVNPDGKRNILGLVSPHAGYMYSGPVAANAFYRLAEDGLPEVAVIIGPNHRSYNPPAALSDHRAWRTPMGDMEVDSEISGRIAGAFPFAELNSVAFYGEHSLEVQLPFLQYLADMGAMQVKIAPILIGASAYGMASEFVRGLGIAIADAVAGRNAVIIASTDFTHYESGESAAGKDSQALLQILALDEEGLLETVESKDITMCGVLPTAAMIVACKRLGAVSAAKLAYRNSGDVTGDYSNVVGYAAVEVRKRE